MRRKTFLLAYAGIMSACLSAHAGQEVDIYSPIGPASAVWTVPSNVTVANGTTVVIPSFPWTSGTITSIHYATNGTSSPSFTASVQIGGVNVTGCSGISVSSGTDASGSCTANNALASGNQVTVVIASVSGSPNQAYVQVNFTHTVN